MSWNFSKEFPKLTELHQKWKRDGDSLFTFGVALSKPEAELSRSREIQLQLILMLIITQTTHLWASVWWSARRRHSCWQRFLVNFCYTYQEPEQALNTSNIYNAIIVEWEKQVSINYYQGALKDLQTIYKLKYSIMCKL